MKLFGTFAVEKCGNSDSYFIFDSHMAEEIKKNTWSLDSVGYVCRNENPKVKRLHVLVVEKVTGKRIPDGVYVDHVNKCKTDNRICNLRLVSPADSAKNLPAKSNNTSGVTGVSKVKSGKYRAYITVNKKQIGLGVYSTLHEAARVRYAAEEQYGFTHRQNLKAFLIEMEGEE